MLTPLRHRPFRLLFFGQLISNLGDWLDLLALLSLLLYEWDLGAPAWGAVLTALSLPAALLGPVAGVWADRWPRRTTMLACNLARAAVVLGLVWAPDAPSVVGLVGAACIRQRRVLLVAVAGTVALGVVAGATDALATPVMQALGVGEGMLGPSFTALGVGYVAAALGVGQRGQHVPLLAILGLALLGPAAFGRGEPPQHALAAPAAAGALH